MPEMQNILGVTTLVSKISCVVDLLLLLNLVSVVFRPLEGRRCDEIQFESVHLGNYYSRKLSFTLKIV